MKLYIYLDPRIISLNQSLMLTEFLGILELYKNATKDAELDEGFLTCTKILFNSQIN